MDRIIEKIIKDTIICPNCGKDTDFPRVFLKVIRPPGEICKHCGKIFLEAHGYPDPIPHKPNIDKWRNHKDFQPYRVYPKKDYWLSC